MNFYAKNPRVSAIAQMPIQYFVISEMIRVSVEIFEKLLNPKDEYADYYIAFVIAAIFLPVMIVLSVYYSIKKHRKFRMACASSKGIVWTAESRGFYLIPYQYAVSLRR